MATVGLYGSTASSTVASPSGSESVGLYGNNTVFGGSYFEWFIFQVSDTQPSTPTGGSWDFTTNTGTPPTGWLASPPVSPTNTVWVSIGLVNSKSTVAITWSVPGKFSFSSGLPILSGTATPLPGDGQTDQLYIETGTTPETIWFKQAGTWTRLTGSTLYADLTSNQTLAGTKTFSSPIAGSVTGTSANVTGIVSITNGGTGTTSANSAFNALAPSQTGNSGKYLTTDGSNTSWATNPLGTVTSVDVSGGTTGLTTSGGPITSSGTITLAGTLAVANGGTGATTAAGARTSLGATTVGSNIFTLANPSAITFPRFNADNTVSSLDAATFRTAIGAGTSSTTGTVTSVAASVPAFLSISGSPITASGTLAIGLSGTALPVANGGTGVTASSGANSVVLRDANVNISANSISEGYSNVAAAGTTVVLTVASVPNYVVTGSGGQTYQLPDATTLSNGANYVFNNNQSSGTIVVKNNSSTTVATIQSGGYVEVVLLSNATAAGSWDVHNQAPSNVSWSTNTFDYPGSITSATWNGVAVAINRGGTGATTANAAFNALAPTQTGNSGKYLTTDGTNTSWATNPLGTVTSVGGTGTVNGLTLTGTVTTSGNLTLGGTLDLSSPPAIGATTPSTGAFTTLSASSTVTLSGGTANGVAYLNGSKVLTTGTALTFDGTIFQLGNGTATTYTDLRINGAATSNYGPILSLYSNGTLLGQVGSYGRIAGGTSTDFFVTAAGSSNLVFGVGSTEYARLTSSLLTVTPGATIQGLTVGRGAGAVSTNTAVGVSALAVNTTGSENTGGGYRSLYSNLIGVANTAYGAYSLRDTTGNYNTAVGNSALLVNSSGAYNTALGTQALNANTTASNNTAVGYQAAYSTTTAGSNTALGYQAFYSNTTGAINTALGYQSLYSNTTGNFNIAVGQQALNSNTTASYNTAVGYQAGLSNTTGTQNVFQGSFAGYNNTTGGYNTAVGYNAYGVSGTAATGSYNTAIGNGALNQSTTASYNTAVGYQAGYSVTTDYGNTFIGTQSGYSFNKASAGSYTNNTFVGVSSGYYITTGAKNTIIGAYTGNQGGLDIRTASNYIVLSDGDGNPRAYWNASGAATQLTSASGAYASTLSMSATSGGAYGYFISFGYAPNDATSKFLLGGDTSASRFFFTSNGGLYNYQANNSNLSDRREKKDFAPAKSYLDVLCNIPVQTFKYIDQTDDEPTLGVVAQDVQAVAPEMVTETNWGTEENPKMRLSIYETDLKYAMLKAIQELKAEFDAYKATHP